MQGYIWRRGAYTCEKLGKAMENITCIVHALHKHSIQTYDIEYIKGRLKDPDGVINRVHSKLWNMDAGARGVITHCLVVDPENRCKCEELLKDRYFTGGF
eukprot:7678749-Ditylum_brightwellii.AAC.1